MSEFPSARSLEADAHKPTAELDLSVADLEEEIRIRGRNVGAAICLALADSVALHPAALAPIRARLVGRTGLVWQDASEVHIAFSMNGFEEQPQLETFAKEAARALGAEILHATSFGIVQSTDHWARGK